MPLIRRLLVSALVVLAAVLPARAQSILTLAGNPARSGVNSLDLALNGGSAVAFGPGSSIYVANGTSVYRIVSSTATLVAGTGVQGPTVEGALGVATRFVQIGGIAVDTAGNLFIADEAQRRVYRVRASDGRVEVLAGGGFRQGTSAPGDEILFSFPSHLAFDASGRLLVGDSLRLYRIDTAARFVTHVAGNGTLGPSGDGGPATAAGVVCGSYGVDAAQNIYCASGAVIRRITPTGIISTFAGTGVSGSTGNGGPALNAQISASVISVSSNQLVFAGSSRIRAIDLTTNIVSALAGTGVSGSTGDGGPATAAQTSPQDIGHFGNLLVIVEGARVRVIVGATIEGLAFNGLTTSGLSGPAFNAQIGRPEHLAADTLGNVYFSASNQVFRRNVDGTVTLIAGLANNSTTSGDGGAATSAGLSSVGGLALDGTGNLYISQNFSNHRIRRVNLSSGIITTFAGTGTGSFSGDGGLATAATLNGPSGMVVVGSVLYVADRSNHRIRAINLSTNIIGTFAGNGSNTFSGDGGAPLSAGLPSPELLAADGTSRLYVTSSQRVRRIAAGVITTRAGTGAVGVPLEGGIATAQPLGIIQGLAASTAGDLYLSDQRNHRVWLVPDSSVSIQSRVGNGAVELSDSFDFGTFSGDGGPAALAGLNDPAGVALDSSGRLVIADISNGRLRRVDGLSNAPPTLSGPSSATVLEDASTVLNFTVGDATTAASALVFTATSSDDTLVDAAGLVVSGSGTARALAITPRPNANGTATITVALLDTDGGVTRRAIALTVTPVNDPPILGPIADVSGQDNAPLIALGVADDIDGPDFDISATSSNQAVLPNGNLDFDFVSADAFELVMTPVAGTSGSSIITVTFTDGIVTLTRSFTATVFLTPQAPVLTRADVDGAAVDVRWSAPVTGVAPTGYLVEAGLPGQPPTVTTVVGATARRADVLLPSSGDWTVRVRTRNNAALSDPATSSTLTVTGVSGRPRDLVAAVSGSLVTFRWTLPTNGTRTGYRLEAGSAATLSDLATLSLPPTATAFSVAAPNGTFFVRLRALNGAGDSRASNEIRLVVGGAPALPAPPDDVQVEAQGGTAVFRWAAPVDGGVPSQFVLDAGSAPGLSNIAAGLPVGAGFAFAAGAPDGTYFVRLRSVNGAGSSAVSNEVVLGLPGAGVPLAAPGLLRANVDASRLVTLAWQAPVEGAATGFVVEAGSASGLANLAVLATGPATALQVSAPPGTYFVRVRAQNALGSSAVSNEVVVVVP